jgi:GR25 family glycosyltransferase involved in LPS biosynthesis
MTPRRINDVFERVVVLNLDRRPDRMAKLRPRLDRLGIAFERFAAIDGHAPAVLAEWQAYAAQNLVLLPRDMRAVRNYREFYLDYDDDLARVAFFEAERGAKAIATPGAWGLLRSMTAIFERALALGWQSLLVLEDDVLFHDDTLALFDRSMAQLTADWTILQLGAMQLHWESDWISWHSNNLYRCHGSSHGAHAFGLRADVLPMLLECCRLSDLPFDIGALHTIKRHHAESCFTVFPNLAIQDATDSDIGMSTIFFREARSVDNIYRWYLPNYGPGAIKDAAGGRTASPAGIPTQIEPFMPESPRQPGLGNRILPLSARRHRPDGNGRIGELMRLQMARIGRRLIGLANGAEPPGGHRQDVRGAVGPGRPRGGEPPLQAFAKELPGAQAMLIVLVGLGREECARALDTLESVGRQLGIVPVVITDSAAVFAQLRARRFAFEYLPPAERQERLMPELDWDLYRLRRLALLRRKWQPKRIVAFGPAARALVDAWQKSPFEDESIARIVGGLAPQHEQDEVSTG